MRPERLSERDYNRISVHRVHTTYVILRKCSAHAIQHIFIRLSAAQHSMSESLIGIFDACAAMWCVYECSPSAQPPHKCISHTLATNDPHRRRVDTRPDMKN